MLESGATSGLMGGGLIQMLVLYAAVIGIFWFFLIRPQRKKQKETEAMQSSLNIGESVLTNGGLYGVVVDKVNDLYIIELGMHKSVRVPVHKSAINAVAEPNLSLVHEEAEEEN